MMDNSNRNRVNIIGAGLAGLSAAITLAKKGYECNLISLQHSERAQSVLAEGGINAALDTMNENDSYENHYEDTMKGGAYLANPNAVYGLTRNAPEIVTWLKEIGVPFNMHRGQPVLRNFGGQKKKRTAYAKSSTGKMIVTAMIDEARKYESQGLIHRYPHHEFIELLLNPSEHQSCEGVRVRDRYSGALIDFYGEVILASGGMNGVFPGMTTGTTGNTGDVTATVLAQGVALSNLEMLQYHPTTIGIAGKRCLVTEAARGEGGRLYIKKNGDVWYFMEEKYPELKNLMPRDVVSREMYFAAKREDCGRQVYLDMTELSEKTWNGRLSDLREEIQYYLGIDAAKSPVPVEPGIHYFMGGIHTDEYHRTNVSHLYAAGECTSQYHGANRLGGNSMLGAIYGGKVAASHIIEEKEKGTQAAASEHMAHTRYDTDISEARCEFVNQLAKILYDGLSIVRSEKNLMHALDKAKELDKEAVNEREHNRILLAKAMLTSALMRRESRGAHYREDYPEQDELYRKITLSKYEDNKLKCEFLDIPQLINETDKCRNKAQV